MPKRSAGACASNKANNKKTKTKPEKDRHAEEHAVAAVYNRAAPGEGALPLRLLNNFFLFVRDPVTGAEQPAGLEDLHNGKVGSLPLRARGQLLEHRSPSAAGAAEPWAANVAGGGPSSSKGRIALHHVRDWVVDHTQPAAAIWLVTSAAWYRLIAPAYDYVPAFQTALLRLRLAVAGANLVTEDAHASFQAVAPQLLTQANAAGMPPAQQLATAGGFGGAPFNGGAPGYAYAPDGHGGGGAFAYGGPPVFSMAGFGGGGCYGANGQHQPHVGALNPAEEDEEEEEAVDTIDTYAAAGMYVMASPAHLQQEAGFLLQQLAPFAGRHIITGGFTQQLGAIASMSPATAMSSVRKLRTVETGAPAADPRARPIPSTRFDAAPHLLPGVLMVWDFCHRYRQLLRLPPFPLARLEAAFLEPAAAGQPQPQGFQRGPKGQALLLRDVHAALLRLLDSADDELLAAPAAAAEVAPAELGPHDAFRPLLGVTWPEMVRTVLQGHPLTQDAATAGAFKTLKGQSYETLDAAKRLAILEALLHIAGDSEALRSHVQRCMPPEGRTCEPGLLGEDGTGVRYLQLGGRDHGGLLFVESPQGGDWGYYGAKELPQLIAWLEGGSDAEQAIADEVFEAYLDLLPPALTGGLPKWQQRHSDAAADGYAGLPPLRSGRDQLAEVMVGLVQAAPFWERGEDWLACRAAVLAALQTAVSGSAFARLLWLVEELTYEEALRGTGWGRRRGWFRDALDKCTTTAVVTAALASHCRRAPAMGLLDQAAFLDIVAAQGKAPPPMPVAQDQVVLVGGAYADARRALQPNAHPLEWPAGWRALETCTVLEVTYTRGQAPVTRAAAEDVSRAATWALLEPIGQFAELKAAEEAPDVQPLPAACDGEIDWTLFSFSHGFRHPRAGSGHPALAPRLVAAALTIAPDGESISLSVKPLPPPKPSATTVSATAQPATASTDAAAAAANAAGLALADGSVPAGGSPTSTTTTAHMFDGGSVHGGQSAASAMQPHAQQVKQEGGALAAQQPQQGGWHAGPQLPAAGFPGYDLAPGGRGMPRIESTESSLHTGGVGGRRGVKRDSADTVEDDEGMVGGAKRSMRSTRRGGGTAEFYELDRDNLARIKAEPVAPKPVLGGLRRTASGNLVPVADDAPIQFWVKRRRLVAVELRPTPPAARLPQFVLPPATVAAAAAKTWPPGTGVKMPMAGTLADALAEGSAGTTRWHTGILPHGFDPAAAGAAARPERLMGALYVVWDEATLPPLPSHISPWEVAEDAGRKSRQVERSRAEALAQARKVAALQTRQETGLTAAGAPGRGRGRSAAAAAAAVKQQQHSPRRMAMPQQGAHQQGYDQLGPNNGGRSSDLMPLQQQPQQQQQMSPQHGQQQRMFQQQQQPGQSQQQGHNQGQARGGFSVPASALAALPARQQQLLHASRAAAAAGKQLAPQLQAELVALYRQLQAAHQQTMMHDGHGGGGAHGQPSGLPPYDQQQLQGSAPGHMPPQYTNNHHPQQHGSPGGHHGYGGMQQQWHQEPQPSPLQQQPHAQQYQQQQHNSHYQQPNQWLPQGHSPPLAPQQQQPGHPQGGHTYQNGWQQPLPQSQPHQAATS